MNYRREYETLNRLRSRLSTDGDWCELIDRLIIHLQLMPGGTGAIAAADDFATHIDKKIN